MSKIEEILLEDLEEERKLLKTLPTNGDEFLKTQERIDKIRNELIKVKQINAEADAKFEQVTQDISVRRYQIDCENKHEKYRNWITIGTFLGGAGLSLFGMYKTFKFDKEATPTSTMGRDILKGFVPKMFKRH